MKFTKSTPLASLAALAIAVTLCLCPSALHAQSQQQHATAHAQSTPHNFTGVLVALKNGHYALVMGRGPKGQPMGHMLDHTGNAKKYVGKEVEVTGKLNMSSNTVEVTRIQSK